MIEPVASPALRVGCRIGLGLGLGAAMFIVVALLLRNTSGRHIDDVHPNTCEYLSTFLRNPHPRYLWIIPIQGGVPMSANMTWCRETQALASERGLVLGMHGVIHDWWEAPREDLFAAGDDPDFQPGAQAEFEGLAIEQARERVARGLAVWRECFNGTEPTHFSFPGQWGSLPNVRMLRDEFGFTLRTLFDGLVGKVYHCEDSWCAVTCKSWFVDLL